GLIGIALSGIGVGILWPGTFSKAAAALPAGGTAMFAILALAGDLGCSAGPTLAGFIASAAGDQLRTGILAAVIFPLMMTGLLVAAQRRRA
ncbi:MAG: MFS transporter, partial [Clostridia bacterium]|nr:MFS transporter [Clostridia bacterium]